MVERHLAKVVMRVRFPYLAPGPLEKWLNSYAFHAYTHGFESRTGHHICAASSVGRARDFKLNTLLKALLN